MINRHDWGFVTSKPTVILLKVLLVSPARAVPINSNSNSTVFLLFPVENTDDRIHPKTVIFGIEVNGIYKAYKEDDLKELRTIEDTVGGVKIGIERDDAGIVRIINLETGEEIVKERDFWFAWYAFHPDTELYTE